MVMTTKPVNSPVRSIRSKRTLRRRLTGSNVTPWLWLLAVVFFVVIPLFGLVWTSLELPQEQGKGLGNYAEVLTRDDIFEAIFNSFWVAGVTTIGCVAVAVPLAYFVSRTDMPCRRFFRATGVLTFAAPGFIAAMGWILLLGPSNGLLNKYIITAIGLPPFNIFSPQGVILTLVFFTYPLVFLPVTEALDNMDHRLEEAAQSLGAGRIEVLRKVTLPVVTPSIFSGCLLIFTGSFVIFGPVALLGGPSGFETISTAMYRLMMTFPPRIEYAAVLGLPVMVLLAALIIAQRQLYGRRRFTTVGGKPTQRHVEKLGPWRIPALLFASLVFVISIVLPFGVLLLTSFRKAIALPLSWENFVLFDNYRLLFEKPGILQSFWNSLWIAVVATMGAIALAILAAWLLERSRSRLRPLIQPVMLAPLAFPGAILGVAMVLSFSGSPFWMGGTFLIMVIGFMIRVIPQSFTYVHSGFKQIGSETEEAAVSLGASWLETMRRVTIPLLRGPILSVGIINFVLLFRELDIAIFLYTGANPVAPVILYNLASESQFQLMGALAVVMLAINLGVIIIARKFLALKF